MKKRSTDPSRLPYNTIWSYPEGSAELGVEDLIIETTLSHDVWIDAKTPDADALRAYKSPRTNPRQRVADWCKNARFKSGWKAS